ncbi:MAG: hypothetical protein JWQ07_3222 [Ramlibacter sp.]|nr:hypothetical protein [Ramlibacter sp.]
MNAEGLLNRRQACWHLACCGGALALPTSAASQKVTPFCEFSVTRGWGAKRKTEYITHRAGPKDKSGVPQVVNSIYQALSIKPQIEIFLAEKENNAFATVAGGKRIIVVDVEFVETVNKLAKTNWGAIQVIAHELGHHVAGFSADRHKAELNADYWSGQALQRLGASRAAATKAIMVLGSEGDTESHPSKHRRAPTIERGWDDAVANKIDYSFCEDCR